MHALIKPRDHLHPIHPPYYSRKSRYATSPSVPIQARWTGDRIEVVGSFEVALADYEIEPPTGFLVLSIADVGTVELNLLFEKAS